MICRKCIEHQTLGPTLKHSYEGLLVKSIVSNLDFEAILEFWGKKHVHKHVKTARMVTESQPRFPAGVK
jgi:hypothetical protein